MCLVKNEQQFLHFQGNDFVKICQFEGNYAQEFNALAEERERKELTAWKRLQQEGLV